MNKTTLAALFLASATLTACGSNFEWFPKVPDTTAPTITATVGGKTIFSNSTTHVASLPATVTFATSEAATVFYTTNGSEPTQSSASVATTTVSVPGPTISVSGTILKFFGIDQSSNKNSSATQTTTIKSP